MKRVCDEIGAALPEDCRCLVYATPALVHPKTGIRVAFCNATTYLLCLTGELVAAALQAAATTKQKWAGGREMDTKRDLGSVWVFWGWFAREPGWWNAVYEAVSRMHTG